MVLCVFCRDEIPNIQNAASYLGIQEVLTLCSLSADSETPVSARDTIYVNPCSPLSPDDYEPLEPLEQVEERMMPRNEEEQEKAAPFDDTAHGKEKRIRKPRTRLYEEEENVTRKESPLSPRGRGRGRGRPRGRPRTRPLDFDREDVVAIDKSVLSESTVVRRGTGRPRGRPRTRPLSAEAADSTSTEENATVVKNDEKQTGAIKSEGFDCANPQRDVEEVTANNEDTENKTTSDTENPLEPAVVKRGRGRPRTKSLPSESTEILMFPEETFTQILQKEDGVHKRDGPCSKTLMPEIPESDNAEGGEGTEQEQVPDQENDQPKASSSEPADNQHEAAENANRVRTSGRKRSLSRKLRENQANTDDNEQDEAVEEEYSEDWDEEKDLKMSTFLSQPVKLRPICNICGNLFSEMSSLRRHMRIHKGLKPYMCQLCGRCFRQGNQLKTHLRIHTGNNLLYCEGRNLCKVRDFILDCFM